MAKYEYIFNGPDTKVTLPSDQELPLEEFDRELREGYEPVVTQKQWDDWKTAATDVFPAGILVRIKDDSDPEKETAYLTSSDNQLVPYDRYAQGLAAIEKIDWLDDAQRGQLTETFANSFAEGLEKGRDEAWQRNALAGFKRSGLGSLVTSIRGNKDSANLSRKVLDAFAFQPFQPAPSFVPAKFREKLDAMEANTTPEERIAGLQQEFQQMGYISSLPEAETLLGKAGDFLQQMPGGIASPENLISANPAGIATKSLLRRALARGLAGAAENVAAEVLIQPLVQHARGIRGEQTGLGAAAEDIGMAAAGGAALRNVFGTIGDAMRGMRSLYAEKVSKTGADKIPDTLTPEQMTSMQVKVEAGIDPLKAFQEEIGIGEKEFFGFIDGLSDAEKVSLGIDDPMYGKVLRADQVPATADLKATPGKRSGKLPEQETVRPDLATPRQDAVRQNILAKIREQQQTGVYTTEDLLRAADEAGVETPDVFAAIRENAAPENRVQTAAMLNELDAINLRLQAQQRADKAAGLYEQSLADYERTISGMDPAILELPGDVRVNVPQGTISQPGSIIPALIDRANYTKPIRAQLELEETLRKSPEGAALLRRELQLEEAGSELAAARSDLDATANIPEPTAPILALTDTALRVGSIPALADRPITPAPALPVPTGRMTKRPLAMIDMEQAKAKAPGFIETGAPMSLADVSKGVQTLSKAPLAETLQERPQLAQWAEQIIEENRVPGQSADISADDALLTAWAVRGANALDDATPSFKPWHQQMVRLYGPSVRKHLGAIWGRMAEWVDNKARGAVWNRAPFLHHIKDSPGYKPIETRLQMYESAARGRNRLFRDWRLPEIENRLRTSAKELGMDASAFRKAAYKYAHAVHALDLNRLHGDGASNKTNVEAQEIINNVPPEARAAYQQAQQDVLDVLQETRDMALEAGLWDQKLYDTLQRDYPNYVPSKRILDNIEDMEDALPWNAVEKSKSQSVTNKGVLKFKGSKREVEDLLNSAVSAYEDMVRRVHKNNASKLVLEDLRANPEVYGKMFKEVRPRPERSFKLPNGSRQPIWPKVPEGALALYENGKPIWIQVDQSTKAGQAIGAALTNGNLMGIPKLPAARIMVAFTKFLTRQIAVAQTTGNTDFAPAAYLRDRQETWVNLQRMLKDMDEPSVAHLTKEDVKSMATIVGYYLSKLGENEGRWLKDALNSKLPEAAQFTPDLPMLREYREFIGEGGSVGGRGAQALRELNEAGNGSLINPINWQGFKQLAKGMDAWMHVFEDAPRFTAYREARARGFTPEQAAQIARNSSYDPDMRSGTTDFFNVLFTYAGTAAKSTVEFWKSMKDPNIAARFVGGVTAAGLAVSAWNEYILPGWRNHANPFFRYMTLSPIINVKMVVGKDGVAKPKPTFLPIPLMHGAFPIMVATDAISRKIWSDQYDLDMKQVAKDFAAQSMNAFAPIPLQDDGGWLPSFMSTPWDLRGNRDWLDRTIKPEPTFGANPREFSLFKDEMLESPSGRFLISLARGLQENTGVDISPEYMDHFMQGYFAGYWKEGKNVYDIIGRVLTGKGELTKANIPILRKFMRTVDEETWERAGQMDKALKDENELKRDYDTERQMERQQVRVRTLDYLEKLNDSSTEEANAILDDMLDEGYFSGENGAMNMEQFQNLVKNAEKSLTAREQEIGKYPVSNGSRAKRLFAYLQELDPEEQFERLAVMTRDKVVSKDVFAQLRALQMDADRQRQLEVLLQSQRTGPAVLPLEDRPESGSQPAPNGSYLLRRTIPALGE